jgi:hypothetical protein
MGMMPVLSARAGLLECVGVAACEVLGQGGDGGVRVGEFGGGERASSEADAVVEIGDRSEGGGGGWEG